jgi:hypothetical protein
MGLPERGKAPSRRRSPRGYLQMDVSGPPSSARETPKTGATYIPHSSRPTRAEAEFRPIPVPLVQSDPMLSDGLPVPDQESVTASAVTRTEAARDRKPTKGDWENLWQYIWTGYVR